MKKLPYRGSLLFNLLAARSASMTAFIAKRFLVLCERDLVFFPLRAPRRFAI